MLTVGTWVPTQCQWHGATLSYLTTSGWLDRLTGGWLYGYPQSFPTAERVLPLARGAIFRMARPPRIPDTDPARSTQLGRPAERVGRNQEVGNLERV